MFADKNTWAIHRRSGGNPITEGAEVIDQPGGSARHRYHRVLAVTVFVLFALFVVAPARSAAAEGSCSQVYVVAPGDTLSRIAARCHTTVSALRQANPGISNPDLIAVGQRLTIPGEKPKQGRQPGPPIFRSVTVYLIELEAGQVGNIGCGDAVVPVRRNIAPTRAPLTAAVRELLALRGRYLGQSGLYNALYQSDLRVQAVSVRNGQAIIQLVGRYAIGGVCDAPRVEAQFERTARQFATVNTVHVFINGVPLETLNSGR